MNLSNIWQHPKTSVAGVLICVLTVSGVLSQQGISLGTAGTGTVVALIGALAAAFLGLMAKDPGSPSSTLAKLPLLIVAMCVGTLWLTGCPQTTAVHKCSVAAADIGAGLNAAATVNHQMLAAGEESQEEAATVATYIDQAAKTNDAFVKSLQALPAQGTQLTDAGAIALFNTLVQQVNTLNQEGVLRLKSAKAQTAFAGVMSSIEVSEAAVEAVLIAAPSAQRRGHPLTPAPAVPLLALALTPAEIDELISLAIAAGSALASKLISLRGETDPQLQNSALTADAAAEAQAEADEKTSTA